MAEAISGLTGSVQGSLNSLTNSGTQWLDKIFPPEKRNAIIAWITKFAKEKPMLASFLASHIALTGFPLGLFLVMTISVAIFALLAALILGVLGAVLFIVVCVGFALIILLPILFITTGFATFIWLWGLAAYYILKKFNQKEIPGIHKPLDEGAKGEAKDWVQDEPRVKENKERDAQVNGGPKESKGPAGKVGGGAAGATEKIGMNGAADKLGKAGKSTGVDVGNPKEAADVGKVTGKASSATQGATKGVKGAVPVDGVKSALPV